MIKAGKLNILSIVFDNVLLNISFNIKIILLNL